MSTLDIAGRRIGAGQPVYVVAELSGNHNGDIGRAAALIEAAKDAGADAVKLQTYTADTITMRSDLPWFKVPEGSLWAGATLHELYERAFTPWEWFPRLIEVARGAAITLFSSAYDRSSVDLHVELGLPAHKIASFELIDHDLIGYASATGLPVLLSTGMATLREVSEAVEVARAAGAAALGLFHCNSGYPAPPAELNLRTIGHLAEAFGIPIGFSDHTIGAAAAGAAVAMGATMIEKHLTLAVDDGGPDGAFSIDPAGLRRLVEEVRIVEAALGEVSYGPTDAEKPNMMARRSLFVVEDMKAGEKFSAQNLRSIRPSAGLAPKHLAEVLGRSASRDISRGTPLSWDLIG